ncbi:hypothetical protein [uncultured Fibrella sp.]|uniref:hypothetical protein n=1 Tax=uncultured Fibrella sp. TaxID=1284596 RepID=UPI0035C9F9AA
MKTIKMSVPLVGLLVLLMASCGPSYLNTGVGYGQRPYYGNRGYVYSQPRVIVAPPVVVRPPYYGGYANRNARGGYGGSYGGGRSRGRRW